jgi:hypothetical protein
MANSRIVNLNPDLALLWRLHFNFFNAQVLARFPGNCSLYSISSTLWFDRKKGVSSLPCLSMRVREPC